MRQKHDTPEHARGKGVSAEAVCCGAGGRAGGRGMDHIGGAPGVYEAPPLAGQTQAPRGVHLMHSHFVATSSICFCLASVFLSMIATISSTSTCSVLYLAVRQVISPAGYDKYAGTLRGTIQVCVMALPLSFLMSCLHV